MDRLARKFETAKTMVPPPETQGTGSRVGVLGYGTTHWAILESRDQLREEHRLETDYLRLRAFPFPEEVGRFLASHDRVYVVEQNRDAQMLALLRIHLPEHATRLRSVLHYSGLPVDARSVTDAIAAQESAVPSSPNGARR
jgi:2-oxoglutarate ferredoxin oxidoreductase subunit alpha